MNFDERRLLAQRYSMQDHRIPSALSSSTRRNIGSASRRKMLLSTFLGAILLSGCSPGRDVPPVTPYVSTTYHLGIGDRIRLITFGEQALSQDFIVGDGGTISVPLLGTVHAAGLTVGELGTAVAAELRQRKFYRDPSVVAEIEVYRPIFVLGEVAKPGQYPYQPGMTMLTAVAVAGGYTYRSVEDYAYVVRPTDTSSSIGKIMPQDFVKPGDVIKVYERFF